MSGSVTGARSLGGRRILGRDAELLRIEDCVLSAGGPVGAILIGDSGVGKTAVARVAVAQAAVRGFCVRWVSATESAKELPLGAFAGVLSTAADARAFTNPTQMLAFATRELLGLGSQLILSVDDAHHLDPVSAVLVQQLVLQRSARVVATSRAGAVLPDAVSSVITNGMLRRLSLAPLDESVVDALIDESLSDPVERHTRRWLKAMSQGNPLYLRHLLEDGIESGLLKLRDGLWQSSRGFGVPLSLIELVTSRMGALGDAMRDLVDILALAEPLSLTVVDRLVDPSTTENAEERGLVDVEREPSGTTFVRLAHPIYGEARRNMIALSRARRLRARIGEAMADPQSGHFDDVLRRALIAMDSDRSTSVELLLAALDEAAHLVDVPVAFRIAKASVRAGGGFEAQAYLSNLSALMPGTDPAKELERLSAVAETDNEKARADVMRVAHLAWEANAPDLAEAELARAAAAQTDPKGVSHIAALRCLLDAQLGRPLQAAIEAQRLLAHHDLDGDALVIATSGLVAGRCATGQIADLPPAINRALRHPSTLAKGVFVRPLLATYALGLIAAGQLDDAEAAVSRFVSASEDTGPASAVSAAMIGRIELARGRLHQALPLLIEARAGFAYFGGWRYLNQIALVQVQSMIGELDAAERACQELNEHIHPTMRFWEPDRLVAVALLAARRGATSTAIEQCDVAAATARLMGAYASEVVALQQCLNLGSTHVVDRLNELASKVDGPRVRHALAHADALGRADPEALALASEQWESSGDGIAAAIAAAQGIKIASRESGRTRGHKKITSQRRAADLIRRCGSPHLPEIRSFSAPLPLTSRESEVVALVSLGMSNKEVADQLNMSVRTVEGHVYHATIKLGVARSEFKSLFRDAAPSPTGPRVPSDAPDA